MTIHEKPAKSLLRKHKRVDSWFLAAFGMNLYRGCAHDCAYCDGRSEGYYVEGEFGHDVVVKTNAAELLRREVDPRRKRKPFKKAYALIGGGVGDAWQPIEREYGLARAALEVLEEFEWPVHVLTKSCLVERDLDVIQRIHEKRGAMVSMSFSTVDDELAAVFEPGCSSPSERLATLARFREAGVPTGILLMPVLPLVSDGAAAIEASVRGAAEAGVDFVLFGGLTLKQGRQREHYLATLERHAPGVSKQYAQLYGTDRWGNMRGDRYGAIARRFETAAQRHGVARRIPPRLWADLLDEDDRVVIALEHLDYFLRAEGGDSPFGQVAQAVARLEEPLATWRDKLRQLRGVGPATERIILEFLDTGRSKDLDAFFPK